MSQFRGTKCKNEQPPIFSVPAAVAGNQRKQPAVFRRLYTRIIKGILLDFTDKRCKGGTRNKFFCKIGGCLVCRKMAYSKDRPCAVRLVGRIECQRGMRTQKGRRFVSRKLRKHQFAGPSHSMPIQHRILIQRTDIVLKIHKNGAASRDVALKVVREKERIIR